MADIILVEDNASIARAYAKGLEVGGHRVRIAASEQTLRQLLEAQVPDLVILDISLPGIDGLEILRELREEPNTAQTKVAILSNYSDRNLVHRALRLDAIDYLEKTAVTPSLLVDQVERWLARQPG